MAERTNLATQRGVAEADDRSAREIREDIAAKRETIAETVDKLTERIHDTFDWHKYVTQYPMVALGLAAGAGFLVTGLFKREPTPQERIMDALADLTEDLTDRLGSVAGEVVKKKVIKKTFKAAFTTLVTKAVVDFARQKARDALSDNQSRSRSQHNFPQA